MSPPTWGPFGVFLLCADRYGWPSWSEVVGWDALWVPQSFGGFSAFFGVAVFSYGATIIIVEIQVCQSGAAPCLLSRPARRYTDRSRRGFDTRQEPRVMISFTTAS